MTIEQRVERLERQNRRLRLACLGFFAVTVAGCAMGMKAARQEVMTSGGVDASQMSVVAADIVRARRVEVMDDDGKAIVTLALNKPQNGGVVYTSDRQGTLIAQMGVADDGRGVVWTYGPNGIRRHSVR